MTLADAPAYRALVRQVAAGRGKPASDEQLDGLWLLVNDLDFAAFEQALIMAARETRWFPTAAEIHAVARKCAADHAVAPATLAAIAAGDTYCRLCDDTGWRETTRDARRVYGERVQEVWSTPRTSRTVVAGEVPRIEAVTQDRFLIGRFDPAAVPAVTPCNCRASNPIWQAKRATQRRAGAAREEGA